MLSRKSVLLLVVSVDLSVKCANGPTVIVQFLRIVLIVRHENDQFENIASAFRKA